MVTITVDIPDNLLNLTANIEKAAISAVNTTVDAVAADFQSSVQHFNHKPTFTKERAQVQGDVVRGSVWTDDNVYKILNNGSPDHQVGAPGQLMPFRGWPWIPGNKGNYPPVYHSKSVQGQIPSRPGGPISGTIRRVARGPFHIKAVAPRNYDQLIADKNQPVLSDALNRALKIK